MDIYINKENYSGCEVNDQKLLEDPVINYLLNFTRNLLEIKGIIPNYLYDKLVVRRKRAFEEDHNIREKSLHDLFTLIIVDEMKNILNKSKGKMM